jgi:hypothetical protein
MERKAVGFCKTQLPENRAWKRPQNKSHSMILFVDVDLKEVNRLGKKYSWKKPAACPRCLRSHVRGHGFTGTFFDGFLNALLMRRFRCPACGCVMKCRPKSHFARIQTAIGTIRSHLAGRIETGRWFGSPERGRYWLSALRRQVLAHLGLTWRNRLLETFDQLYAWHGANVSSTAVV